MNPTLHKALASACAATLWLCSSSTAMATQATRVDVSAILTLPVYLTSSPTTIETQRTSASGDTYLRVMDPTGTVEVAGNDDNGDFVCPGFFCYPDTNSRVTFTPPAPGYYTIMVHSKTESKAGRTDVFVNGSQYAFDIPFGGEMFPVNFAQNEQFRATAQSRDPGCNRGQLYLIQNGFGSFVPPAIVEGDRTFNGPNYDAFFETSVNPNSIFTHQALVGLASYPYCATGTSSVLFTVEENPSTKTDSDNDALSDALEYDLSTDPFKQDSDDDGIGDYLETLGNNGLSFATGGYHPTMGPTPATTRNIYIEVLQMLGQSTPLEYSPPAGYAQELAATFESDSDDGIQIEWLGITQIPYTPVLAKDTSTTCTSSSICVSVPELKSTYFDDPSKQTHVHVGFLSNIVLEAAGRSGVAEFGGNDFIVSAGILRNNTTSQAEYEDQFRGTFLHELGHNLGLTHSFNDDVYGEPWSDLHGSVMNYKFQFGGVGNPSGPYTYSTGTYDANGDLVCNPCSTSTKGACAYVRDNFGCFYSVSSQVVEIECDCDVDEWSDVLRADLRPTGTTGWDDGVAGRASVYSEGPQDTWVLPRGNEDELPRVTAAQRRAHVALIREHLATLDLVEGTDYVCSADKTRCYMY
jgi:hypothetical protein